MAVSGIKCVSFILVVISILARTNGIGPSWPAAGKNDKEETPDLTGYTDDDDSLLSDPGSFHSALSDNISCPRLCRCSFKDSLYEVDCVGLGLTSVPEDIPESTNSLLLSNNQISRIHRLVFQKLSNIKFLSLAYNNFSFIHVNSFRDLPNLVFLDLSGNSIGNNLPSSVFSDLTSLKILNLSATEINVLSNTTLQDLTSLTELHLSHNQIRNLGDDLLDLVDLELLDLSHNEVQITASTFDNCSSLTRLYLQGNEIDDIPPNAFVSLTNLRELDLSFNRLEVLHNGIFEGLTSLEKLSLQNNRIKVLCDGVLKPLHKLEYLNASANYLSSLQGSPFAINSHLKTMDMSRMPYLNSVAQNAFKGLHNLEELLLGNSPRLASVHPESFQCLNKLKELDVSNCNLSSLDENFLSSLPNLQKLSAYGNAWVCDCSLQWLLHWQQRVPEIDLRENMTCSEPDIMYGQNAWTFEDLNCSAAAVLSQTKYVMYKVGSSALLECDVAGDPFPTITWITPNMGKFKWYPSYVEPQSIIGLKQDASVSDGCDRKSVFQETNRIQVLDNGNLYITEVVPADVGHYMCIASNHLGSANTTISFLLDFKIINEVKIVSMLVGLATAIIFTFITLLVQFIYMAINRWGLCCCCEGYVSPKTRQIRSILESVEQYRGQQLDRLRENYNAQVQRIKDNCTQQVERIRDTYSADRLKDIREYSTQHLSSIRDNYYEQVTKVRDYSVQQINKVRENYIFQRNRVRKFSTHQMIKLRENYKVQQLHLNKILENLNMESCRTTCGRTDSIIFNSDETLGPLFSDPFKNLEVSPPNTPLGVELLPYRMDDMSSRGSQYFTPVDGNSICEGGDNEELPRPVFKSASRTILMIDKCVGTSTSELNVLSNECELAEDIAEKEETCTEDIELKFDDIELKFDDNTTSEA